MLPGLHMLKHRQRFCNAPLAELFIPQHAPHQPQPGRMQHCLPIGNACTDTDINPHGHLLRNGDYIRI